MIVLHAPALLCAALAEPRSEWVITQVVHDEVTAPAHQPTWVLGSLLALTARGLLGDDELRDAVRAVVTLPQQLQTPDAALLQRAAALTTVLPLLDGLHVALAERLDVPLVTTDGPRLRAISDDVSRCQVVSPPAWLYPDRDEVEV